MTREQWTAIYDYCVEYGYDSPKDVLAELKANGTVARSTMITELDEYVSDTSYDDMYQFLEDNL